jgi:hypothetical protein
MFKPVATLLILTLAVVTWWIEFGRYSPSERDLFGRVEAVTKKDGPSSTEIVHEFGLPSECTSRTCFFKPSKIGRVTYAGGNIRNGRDGLIFELDDLGGDCISTAMAKNWFGGAVTQGCVDSVCWYFESKRKWGTVNFGLNRQDSTCVSSVVINRAR